jgi:hypothetical protein
MSDKKKKTRWILITLTLSVLTANVIPVLADDASRNSREEQIVAEAASLIPLGVEMVAKAEAALSKGWDGMSPQERQLLSEIYDPGSQGGIDQDFVESMIANYAKIRRRMAGELRIAYAAEGEMCTGQRLYYTNFMRIYVCPYFVEEDDTVRKARVLVHEVAHMALLAVDRPYYDPRSYSSMYNALTPRSSWASQIPVVGHILREIAKSDTLYHPDAYAWFAALVVDLES